MAALRLTPDTSNDYFDALGDLLLALWTGILAGWVAYYVVGVAGLRRTLPADGRRRAGIVGLLAAPLLLWAGLWGFTLLYTSGLQTVALAVLPVLLTIPLWVPLAVIRIVPAALSAALTAVVVLSIGAAVTDPYV